MKSFLLLVGLTLSVAAQDLTINTPVPGAYQCQPLLLVFGGGAPPYFIVSCSLLFRHLWYQPPLDILTQQAPIHVAKFEGQTSRALTWGRVNATVGTQLLLRIKDSTGAIRSSAPFRVISGSV
ncbi:hypothetical protein B0H14DRAFT_3421722 [Mycena olivaceomarginata]|nr:hypothetical protein B0H14DRAFT_3421722 [Mycena olivaceomarginata]